MQNYLAFNYWLFYNKSSLREPLGSWQSPLLRLKLKVGDSHAHFIRSEWQLIFCTFGNKLLYLWCSPRIADIIVKVFRYPYRKIWRFFIHEGGKHYTTMYGSILRLYIGVEYCLFVYGLRQIPSIDRQRSSTLSFFCHNSANFLTF